MTVAPPSPVSLHGATAPHRGFRATAPWLLFGVLQVAMAANAAAAPAAEVFLRVDNPERIDAQWQSHLCALLPQPCKPDTLSLHTPRGAATGEYVVLSTEPLAMARLRRIGAAWQLVSTHDFTGYRHSMADAPKDADADSFSPPSLSLAPALYPLGPDRWAAAILWTTTASYSGGGAGYSTADFVALDPNAGTARTVHAGIPFSCSVTIRACFSEKEYAQSPHCHDETEGSLRIGYQESAQAGGTGGSGGGGGGGAGAAAADFRWRFTWSESTWRAHKPASSTRRTTLRFSDASNDTVSFCDGP
ncbi:hypothetical protein BH10PSE18_BH10PSE18_29240 [soil metagenome]